MLSIKSYMKEVISDVIYDTEENPTLAQLPLSVCRFIEAKLNEAETREEKPEAEPQPVPKEELYEKPKEATGGVRRVHTSRAWKYIDRN